MPLMIGLGALGANAAAAADSDSSTEFLRSYAETRGFMLGRPSKAKPSPDGKSVLFLQALPREAKQSLFIFDVESRKSSQLLTPSQVLKGASEQLSAEEKARRERQRISVGGFTDFQLSDDSNHILVSLSGKLYLIERKSSKVKELATGDGDVLDPKFSPDSRSVSYVQNNDIHIIDIETGKSRQLSKDGSKEITHGLAEFVAQEEMSRFSGYWWSPDSQYIAFEEVDHKGVEVWHISDPEHPENTPTAAYYPRPGKPNVKASMHVIPAAGGKPLKIDWDCKQGYEYLASVGWSKNSPLTLVVLSRDQKKLQLLAADTKTGKTTVLLEEIDDKWINLHKKMPLWLADGSAFLWVSEKDGFPQLELHAKDGKLKEIVVDSSFGLREVIDLELDEKGNSTVYFAGSSDPRQILIHKVGLDGKSTSSLSKDIGIHEASFSKNHSIYVQTSSLEKEMPFSAVFKSDGTLLGKLPSVAEEPPLSPHSEYVDLDGPENFHAIVTRPSQFNSELSYPVLLDVYGGPHSLKVLKNKKSYLLDQWLADRGFIVVSVDGRGTPGRGRAWERAVAHKFGSLPLEDQVSALETLCKRYPEMDGSRIGVTGWSFGGYMSALAVLRRPDIFKAAAAGAPVVDWMDYDSCYTERYLGLPESSADAYKEASLLSYASGLERPLLLIHGTTDDNVYFKHSLKLADALFRSGKQFEILPLSGLTHMVPDPVVMENLWKGIVRHFKSHLGEPTPKAGKTQG